MASGRDERQDRALFPREPIHGFVAPLQRFLHVESASGVVLLVCAVLAIILANSRFAEGWLAFWKIEVGVSIGGFSILHSLKHWINDGLMAVFFFVVGLEVKRELVLGELRDPRRAALPVAAALGGMIVPALLYLILQSGEVGARGYGIPMATDIAFVVGCMALLGPRIPNILRVMLLSLAIVDDIGAILVIAIGYTSGLDWTALLLGLAGLLVIGGAARLGVRSLGVYVVLGFLVWLAVHESGVHATLAGVLLGLMTPARSYIPEDRMGSWLSRASEVLQGGDWHSFGHRAARIRELAEGARETISPLEYLEQRLHPWTSFVIMPAFALANAGVPIQPDDFANPVATAVMVGLVIGKPLGIFLFSWLTVKLILKALPEGLSWRGILGGGCLAGIGFTMALFIASLALEGEPLDAAKVGILGASLISALLGMAILRFTLPKPLV